MLAGSVLVMGGAQWFGWEGADRHEDGLLDEVAVASALVLAASYS